VIFELEKEFAAKNQKLEAAIFFSVGSLEESKEEPDDAKMVSNLNKIVEIMQDREYEGLKLVSHIFDDETHLSVLPAAVSRGLRKLYLDED
jgi:predicted alpha/beta superfamily hydrolase